MHQQGVVVERIREQEMEKNLFAHYMHRCCTLFSLVCQYNRREEQIRLITLLYCSVAEYNYPTIAHKVISITDRSHAFVFTLFVRQRKTFVNIDVVNFWPHFSKKQQYNFRKRIFRIQNLLMILYFSHESYLFFF